MTHSPAPVSVPVPQIQDIVPNHGAGRPPLTNDLDGQTFALLIDGTRANIAFGPKGALTWSDERGSQVHSAEALQVRPGIYFVDYVHRSEPQHSTTIILDLNVHRALLIDVTAPGKDIPVSVPDRIHLRGCQSAVDVIYRQAGINESIDSPFEQTTDLVGKICRFHYSETHVYDHIYLSERHHAWFCRSGPDAGLGDFDDCDYFKIADRLYVFSWQEKLIPCVGIAVEDHASMRSVGKIFGAHADSGVTANVTVGALMTELGTIEPPLREW